MIKIPDEPDARVYRAGKGEGDGQHPQHGLRHRGRGIQVRK